ncbi:MAG: DUF2924 domain-containing protein [Beijerinckiaceae bacterium]|nr:MAG: DUF2924 domain-containing protein [Beijerinckiaceae bacterium]
MGRSSLRRDPASPLAAPDLEREIARIAGLNKDALGVLWRNRNGGEPPKALSRDLIIRALAHSLQKQHLGGLPAVLRKQLASYASGGAASGRNVKSGSIIIREYQGQIHEVVVVPAGFLWQGQIYGSLSTIARKITGTSWNGPRFFGLRGKAEQSGGKTKEKGVERKSVANLAETRLEPPVAPPTRQARIEVGSKPGKATAADRIPTNNDTILEMEVAR